MEKSSPPVSFISRSGLAAIQEGSPAKVECNFDLVPRNSVLRQFKDSILWSSTRQSLQCFFSFWELLSTFHWSVVHLNHKSHTRTPIANVAFCARCLPLLWSFYCCRRKKVGIWGRGRVDCWPGGTKPHFIPNQALKSAPILGSRWATV